MQAEWEKQIFIYLSVYPYKLEHFFCVQRRACAFFFLPNLSLQMSNDAVFVLRWHKRTHMHAEKDRDQKRQSHRLHYKWMDSFALHRSIILRRQLKKTGKNCRNCTCSLCTRHISFADAAVHIACINCCPYHCMQYGQINTELYR